MLLSKKGLTKKLEPSPMGGMKKLARPVLSAAKKRRKLT